MVQLQGHMRQKKKRIRVLSNAHLEEDPSRHDVVLVTKLYRSQILSHILSDYSSSLCLSVPPSVNPSVHFNHSPHLCTGNLPFRLEPTTACTAYHIVYSHAWLLHPGNNHPSAPSLPGTTNQLNSASVYISIGLAIAQSFDARPPPLLDHGGCKKSARSFHYA